MINLYFNAEKQILTRTDREDLASSSREIHKCNFDLSNDWDDMQITAVFKYMGRKWDVLLTDNACTVPAEVLEGQEGFTVGLYGTNGDQVITSTLITVPVSKGANASGGDNAQITPSMFEQIMQKIDEVEKGEVSPELIYEAVSEYMEAHPLEPIVAEDVAAYFVEHAEELKGPKGDTGATGATGPQGPKGDTGATPVISAAATVDNTTGTPAVNVTKSGTDAAPEFTFAFTGLKGLKGDPGTPGDSIVSIEKTATSGLVDTYTITLTNGNTTTFTVSNGLGIKSADINANGHLIITYSDDTTYDAGALSDIYATAADVDTKLNDVWKAQGELGAKNLLVYPYITPSGGYSGITFTAQSDGSFIVNGTATGYSHINPYQYQNINESNWKFFNLKSGEYKISFYADDYSKIAQGNIVFLFRFLDKRVNPNVTTDYRVTLPSTIHERTITLTQEMVDALDANEIFLDIRIFTSTDAVCNNVTVYPMVCLATDTDNTWQPYAPTNYELMQKNNEISFYPSFAMFEKFGVIGDSYASGYIAPNASVDSFVTNYKLSWGQVAARRNGNTCYNFSEAGLTAKTWLSNAAHGKQALLAEEALQLYIVCLGINDYTDADYPLGTSADIGTQNNSFYGYYSQIIDSIITHAPQAKIILSTMRDGRIGGSASFSATDVNNAIKTIASHYNIPCIEPSDNELFRSVYYIDKMSRFHPTAQVYSAMAKAYEWLIEKAMEDYFDYFKDYVG